MASKGNIVSSDVNVIPAADIERDAQSSRSDTRPKHKGRGAKTRAAEKFRTKKNEDTYNQRMESNRAFRDSFSSSVDGVETALKSLSVGASFFKPPSEVVISQSGIQPLTEATINFMADMKVPTQEGQVDRENDEVVLNRVTHLQMYAKCALARRRGPFERDPASNDLVNVVVSQLSVGLKSTAAYLENVGVCEVAGQQIFPALPANPAAQKPPPGWVETKIRTDEGTLFVNVAGLDPPPNIHSFQDLINLPQDRRQFFQAGLINVSETVVAYTRILARIAKKLPGAVVPIDLESGSGTCAQLVGSKELPAGYSTERQAWCRREIPQMSLVLGAGFEFGLNSMDTWHIEDKTAMITGSVSPCAFFTKLMQVNGRPIGAEAR